MNGKNAKSALRYDILLIAVLLFVSALAVGALLLFRQGGDKVTVEIDGRLVAE